MQLKYFLAASAASLSLATAIATPVMAQETTSAIDGVITGQDGAPVAGAKVTVKHIPTGTVSTAVSDGGGHYSLRGLRVGGPYVVTVEGGGYAAETIDGVQLNVGDTFGLPVQLNTKEIVVSAMVSRFGRQLVTGSQSTYNATDIANTVSARRDIRDVMRKDLLASYNANVGGVSIAGGNIRTQRFSVDGIQMQDSFGLNYGGLPSIRGIISMEAIDQLTVKAAPFDISEGNFQGGAVNVVMKSGSNDFHGSVFGNTGGPSLTGKLTRDNRGVVGDVYPVSATKILNFKNYGASLSGPIIKDTLFFSAAYEFLSEGTPNSFGVQGSAAPNPIPNVFYTDTAVPAGTQVPPLTTADAYSPGAFTLPGLNSVFSTFTSKYGSFAIGDVPTAIAEVDRKYSGKLDWNIAPGHRLSLTA
ncbi:MAG: carboxypeptidase-like regulatory domain-containing protein, partial [Novosphingobium sp.]